MDILSVHFNTLSHNHHFSHVKYAQFATVTAKTEEPTPLEEPIPEALEPVEIGKH